MQLLEKQKNAARKKCQVAVRDGILVRGPCEDCGQTEGIEGHHDDYHKPIQVRWLCPECHRAWHSAERIRLKPERDADKARIEAERVRELRLRITRVPAKNFDGHFLVWK